MLALQASITASRLTATMLLLQVVSTPVAPTPGGGLGQAAVPCRAAAWVSVSYESGYGATNGISVLRLVSQPIPSWGHFDWPHVRLCVPMISQLSFCLLHSIFFGLKHFLA